VDISCSLDRRGGSVYPERSEWKSLAPFRCREGLAVLDFAKHIRWQLLLGMALIACTGVVLWAVYRQSWGRSGPFWDKYQKVQLSRAAEVFSR